MAPTKSHLTMFLVAIVLFAAMPQPSAAVRAEPPTSSTTSPQPWKWNIPGFSSLLPSCFRWPPIFPHTPTPPQPPPPPSKPQPKECLTPLMNLLPCKDFITNSTAPAPPHQGKCCDGYRSLFEETPICLCRIVDRELDNLMSAPVVYERFLYELLGVYQVEPPGPNCDGHVPPMKPKAPTPAAAP